MQSGPVPEPERPKRPSPNSHPKPLGSPPTASSQAHIKNGQDAVRRRRHIIIGMTKKDKILAKLSHIPFPKKDARNAMLSIVRIFGKYKTTVTIAASRRRKEEIIKGSAWFYFSEPICTRKSGIRLLVQCKKPKTFAKALFNALCHEIRHLQQSRYLSADEMEWDDFSCDPTEIDAFAIEPDFNTTVQHIIT